jgi:hypothetical protein
MDAATVAADQASSSWTYSKYLENTWKILGKYLLQASSRYFPLFWLSPCAIWWEPGGAC